MATRRTSSSTSVVDYIESLPDPLRLEVAELRRAILDAVPQAREEVKWNAPSFYLGDHFATLRLHGKVLLQLVLHLGAKSTATIPRESIHDPSGILKWLAKDRACIEFKEPGDVATHSAALQRILRQWVRHVPNAVAG